MKLNKQWTTWALNYYGGMLHHLLHRISCIFALICHIEPGPICHIEPGPICQIKPGPICHIEPVPGVFLIVMIHLGIQLMSTFACFCDNLTFVLFPILFLSIWQLYYQIVRQSPTFTLCDCHKHKWRGLIICTTSNFSLAENLASLNLQDRPLFLSLPNLKLLNAIGAPNPIWDWAGIQDLVFSIQDSRFGIWYLVFGIWIPFDQI